MKLILLAFAFLTVNLTFSQISKNVLFIGNSYTYYNNMPSMLAQMAASTGDNITFDSSTPGGFTFNGHSSNAATLQKIQVGNWDIVVLQEQSQIPSFPISQVQSSCYPYAAKLDSIIRANNSCAETMFYMTWGRENGDVSNCAGWPPVCTYEGMDDLLRQRYEQMAQDNQAVLSPVGALWRNIRQNNPGLQLYDTDGSHPSLAGSYAAACSFYSTILRKDPTLITDDLGLSAADALFIRNAAREVVYDSLLTWHIGEYDPVASFNSTTSYLTAFFTNTSTNACSYLWDFGDGITSNLLHPTHIYNQANTLFTITLVAECCGVSDTATGTFIKYLGLEENEKALSLELSPNPVTDILTIQFSHAEQLTLFNENGQIIEVPIKEDQNRYELDFTGLPAGNYFIRIKKENENYLGRVFRL
jgi:hypothetical protein